MIIAVSLVSHATIKCGLKKIRNNCFRSLAVAVIGVTCSIACFSQTSGDLDVPSSDRKAIRQLAKMFEKRYQRTRSLKPLIPEFFINDFGQFMRTWAINGLDDPQQNQLSTAEVVRGIIAGTDLAYIHTTVFMSDSKSSGGSDYERLAAVFPARLAKELDVLGAMPDLLSDEDFANRVVYLARLEKAETVLDKARQIMRYRNPEGSGKYRKEFKDNENSERLGYMVKSSIDDEGDPGSSSAWGFPPGTRTYSVTIPIGFVLGLVKEKGRFRAFVIGPMIYE